MLSQNLPLQLGKDVVKEIINQLVRKARILVNWCSMGKKDTESTKHLLNQKFVGKRKNSMVILVCFL